MTSVPDLETSLKLAQVQPARRLIIILHGMFIPGYRKAGIMQDFLHDSIADADVFRPRLPHASLLCREDPVGIAVSIVHMIDRVWAAKAGGYDEVLLVGHSMGAALLRKVMLGVWGPVEMREASDAGEAPRRAPFESTAGFDRLHTHDRQWPAKVSRIVLVGGLARGWSVSPRQAWKDWILLNTAGIISHNRPNARWLFQNFRKGAPFIVDTRLQWIDRLREEGRSAQSINRSKFPPGLIEVQMFGTTDEIVAPNDTVDLASKQFRSDYVFLIEVPLSDHGSLLELLPPHDTEINDTIRGRRDRLLAALIGSPVADDATGPVPSLVSVSMDATYLDDSVPPSVNMDVRNVVFVIHGIRDTNDWAKKIAARIRQAAAARSDGADEWKSITPTYGYFPMLPFVLHWHRRQKTEWFMNLYADTAATYPEARFHFVGHSNGTYLAAAALRDYECSQFDRICFAGSVVRSDFGWKRVARKKKAMKVLNLVATSDFVVALAPNAVKRIRYFDLGGAGHAGFSTKSALVDNYRYVEGGHGAGVTESHWSNIAGFIVDGKVPGEDLDPGQGRGIATAARFAPALAVAAAAVIGFVWLELFMALIDIPWPNRSEWIGTSAGWMDQIPIAGSVLSRLGDGLASVDAAWRNIHKAGQFAGLYLYSQLIAFITTRY